VEFAWVTNNCKLSSITTIFSHEMAEAFSDPEGDGIQVNPRGPVNWNEIGDVCNSTLAVDGVTVQSYWSTQDNACIVPYNQSVSYRVTCITKIHPHTDPYSAITWLGGTKNTDGSAWNLSVPEVMRLLDGGDRFYVHGADGSQSDLEAQSAVKRQLRHVEHVETHVARPIRLASARPSAIASSARSYPTKRERGNSAVFK
jgi:hypothetical protein